MKFNKSVWRWIGINLGILFAFTISHLLQLDILIDITLVLTWFIGIAAPLLWMVFKFAEKMATEIYLVSEEDYKSAKSKFKLPIFVFEKQGLYNIIEGSIPEWLDITYDLIFAAIIIYFGYTWLTIAYLSHIWFLSDLRRIARYIHSKGQEIDLESSTQTQII